MPSNNNRDSDKTVFMPLGNAGPRLEPPPFTPVATPGTNGLENLYVAQQTSLQNFTKGLNPIIEAAAPLLTELIALRSGASEEISGLRVRLESSIRAFEIKALASNLDRSQVMAARYVLCTVLDESITTSASMGQSGEWSRHALLSTFHNETWGGEKFFQLLDRCMQQPAQSLYLMELMYTLMSLGFEGRYRVMDRGTIALEALRDKLYRQIRILRGDPILELSDAVEREKPQNRIYRYVPLWAIVLLGFICMAISFFGFSMVLDKRGGTVFTKYEQPKADSQ